VDMHHYLAIYHQDVAEYYLTDPKLCPIYYNVFLREPKLPYTSVRTECNPPFPRYPTILSDMWIFASMKHPLCNIQH